VLATEALALADAVQEAFPFEVTPENNRPLVSERQFCRRHCHVVQWMDRARNTPSMPVDFLWAEEGDGAPYYSTIVLWDFIKEGGAQP